jgi:TM2 domain-containing membrane protein YozV
VWDASFLLPLAPTEDGSNLGLIAVLYYGIMAIVGPFYVGRYVSFQMLLCMWVGLGGYFAVPVSVHLARRSYRFAALMSTLSALAPTTLLASGALRFDRGRVAASPVPSGLLCWILSGTLLTIIWSLAAWRERGAALGDAKTHKNDVATLAAPHDSEGLSS